ncbi:MAG: ammonium transporter [Coxiellaceae bacterium]|nr:ammonium transporter [Coxiellaceae bacterium]
MKRLAQLAILLSLFSLPVLSYASVPYLFKTNAHFVWVMLSSILVLFMTMPGIILFYGGMVSSKNVLAVFAKGIAMMAIVAIVWSLFGYAAVYGGNNISHALVSNFKGYWLGLGNFYPLDILHLSRMINVFFQMSFAIITTVLIVGGFAERMKFSSVLIFTPFWVILVYCPITHAVWGGGFLSQLGILDFAGGTVVHINAGIAGLVAALMLGKRKVVQRHPSNVALVAIGSSILWIGWFGFNGGSAHSFSAAILALMNTVLAPTAAILSWMTIEWIYDGKPTAHGMLFALIAGLVAITPMAGYCSVLSAIVVGLIAGVVCYFSTKIKFRLGYDDALDAFGVHGIGGIVGAILTAFTASRYLGGVGLTANNSLLQQLGVQLLGVVVVLLWSGIISFIILWCIKKTIGLRVSDEQEEAGLDVSLHGEKTAVTSVVVE